MAVALTWAACDVISGHERGHVLYSTARVLQNRSRCCEYAALPIVYQIGSLLWLTTSLSSSQANDKCHAAAVYNCACVFLLMWLQIWQQKSAWQACMHVENSTLTHRPKFSQDCRQSRRCPAAVQHHRLCGNIWRAVHGMKLPCSCFAVQLSC